MLAEIGLTSTVLAFLACLYAIPTALYGGRAHSERWLNSARNAALAAFPLITIACGVLLVALLTEQYHINYVRHTTDPNTPMFYRFTALWGSQEGSLLFWSWVMVLFTTATLIINWKRERRLMPYVIAFSMATLAFFLYLNIFLENPFERVWVLPSATGSEVVDSALIPANAIVPTDAALTDDARGLNPLLRHFGMIIHPPMLYFGFVGFLVPFAFAMAALASGDLSTNWIKATRRWTLVAWLFLSLGLILGGRWAYDVLGWGGYWGWDPVENAAFLPWLLGTAFLHSVMIQEKRGMLKVWNMFLIILTFSAVMFGTFATRSGLVESVHSFARSQIGFPMFLFWASITVVSISMIIWRWSQGKLKEEHYFAGWLSREAMFLLNNIVFVALAAAIFWGSFGAPILSELFLNEDITIGTDYFYRVTPPLFLVMYLLMGVAPLTAWGATSFSKIGRRAGRQIVALLVTVAALVVLNGHFSFGAVIGYGVVCLAGVVAIFEIVQGARARMRSKRESFPAALLNLFTRNRRRYGGYIVHLGIVVIGIGVIGSTLFQVERQETVNRGETMTVNDEYQLRFDDFAVQVASDGRIIDRAYVTVIRDGREIVQLEPRVDNFVQGDGSTAMPMTIAGAHSTLENDFYVLLASWEETTFEQATFKVYINPLVNLVWWGGLILILGTFISAWPNETMPAHIREKTKTSAGLPAGARA
ncbi:MAG: heme lyase CcmF/NrfE family subunit [Anaerolineae bacterium]